ncbi:hypothetical protein CsSME_00018117 [Camellia sinensis var. sinensis]
MKFPLFLRNVVLMFLIWMTCMYFEGDQGV